MAQPFTTVERLGVGGKEGCILASLTQRWFEFCFEFASRVMDESEQRGGAVVCLLKLLVTYRYFLGAELLFLIANFLSSSPCIETAAKLKQELVNHY